MKIFAITGPTGLLCENILYEIIKNNLDDLGAIEILCLGRDNSDHSLKTRLKDNWQLQGWRYLMDEKDPILIKNILERLTPININLNVDGLGLSQEQFDYLNARKIDYFIHPASITDFRNTPKAAARLKEANINGGNRILDLIDSLDQKVGMFSYVSSAYTSGNTFGEIEPDYTRTDKNFRNIYEDTKLTAEVAARNFCRANDIAFKNFRPSTIGGRLLEKPKGYVSKYDVYLGWIYFFVAIKRQVLGDADWESIFKTPMEIPVRIRINKDTGLNIVPADFAAKVIYQAVTSSDQTVDYHLVSQKTIPMQVLLGSMLKKINVSGFTFVKDPVLDFNNPYEKSYYEKVGKIYTPYVAQDAHSDFKCQSMIDICNASDIPITGIDSEEKLSMMLDYAMEHHFGVS